MLQFIFFGEATIFPQQLASCAPPSCSFSLGPSPAIWGDVGGFMNQIICPLWFVPSSRSMLILLLYMLASFARTPRIEIRLVANEGAGELAALPVSRTLCGKFPWRRPATRGSVGCLECFLSYSPPKNRPDRSLNRHSLTEILPICGDESFKRETSRLRPPRLESESLFYFPCQAGGCLLFSITLSALGSFVTLPRSYLRLLHEVPPDSCGRFRFGVPRFH